LKQKGSTVAYTREFKRWANRTGWGDLALRKEYYQGLKEHIKDELLRKTEPNTTDDLIEAAEEIDN
jgi:hypothetical protein